MPRARDLGISIGTLPTGPTNSVLDVAGVGLGHATVHRDEPPPPEGRGVARTGVTCLVLADDAYPRPLAAGGAVLNGAGECTGLLSAGESGLIETPVYLTSTMQLGRVYDAACEIELERRPGGRRGGRDPGRGRVRRLLPQRLPPDAGDARRTCGAAYDAALASRGSATAPPEEGAVGSGTGHVLPGLQGRHRHRLAGDAGGAHGRGAADDQLRRARPADRRRRPRRPARRSGGPEPAARPAGSCIGVVVTDAPVDSADCARLARRVGLGLARTGSTAHHGSGEIFLAASTTARADRDGRPERGRAGRRPGARPAVRGGRRRRGGGGAQLAARSRRRRSAATATPARGSTPRSSRGCSWATVPGTERSVRIPMGDGVELAATLYLPEARASRSRACWRRCPTARTTSPRRTPRATGGCATSTGTPSAGSTCAAPGRRAATRPTSTRWSSATDLVAVIAWLAEQDWCDGNVGMFGTSYSGFNSPAARVRAAAGAEGDLRDLRQRRPVERRRALARGRAAAGGPRRLLPLHDADVRAAAGARGVGPDAWREEWRRRLETNEPWVLTWLRENRDGPYWRAGSVRAGADGDRLRADRVPDDARRGLGRRLPQQLLPHRRGAAARPACRTGCWPGPWAHADPRPRSRARGSTSTPRWWPGGTAGCAAAASTEDRARRLRAHLDTAGARPRPARGLLGLRDSEWRGGPGGLPGTSDMSHAWRAAHAGGASPTSGRRRGSTAPATCRGGCPATSARTTPAR